MMFFGADEESRLVWEAVRSLGRRNYYRGRRFSIPSINHYKIPIQEENVTGNTIAQRTDSRMQRKGKETKLGDRDYYLLAPQHRAFASFCMKLGFSALCRVGCGFGLLAGAARLFCARLGWLCWNWACVEAPSGGASSPMLFRLICESRFIVSRGLLPGWARVAPGFGRGSLRRWWSIGRWVFCCLCCWPCMLTAMDELGLALEWCIACAADGCDLRTSHPLPLFSFIQSYSPSSISPVLLRA